VRFGGVRMAIRSVAWWLVALVAVAGCISVRTSGAASVDDLAAEEQYKAVYAAQMTSFEQALQAFAPTSSSPGACNKGGLKQACYDADAATIRTLRAMQAAFDATAVPPRFVAASVVLKQAIDQEIQGLDLRNQAIAQNDQTLWTQHKPVLESAQASFQEAYQAFPADNRPLPAP
jgi:hypothetical protein